MKLNALENGPCVVIPLPRRNALPTPAGFDFADGVPWQATVDGHYFMTVRCFPDGRAEVRLGSVSRMTSWGPTRQGFCLNGMGSTQRANFRRVGASFVSTDRRQMVMTLTR